MSSYIVNYFQQAGKVEPIIFTQDNAQVIHYSCYDALVVRAIIARNGLKHMLIYN